MVLFSLGANALQEEVHLGSVVRYSWTGDKMMDSATLWVRGEGHTLSEGNMSSYLSKQRVEAQYFKIGVQIVFYQHIQEVDKDTSK